MVISALARAITQDVAKLNENVAELQISQRGLVADDRWTKFRQWLSPPDPSTSHNSACQKRQPTTGVWFTESQHFNKWKDSPNSFLWLHGIRTFSSLW
jgi:hypothetical protein